MVCIRLLSQSPIHREQAPKPSVMITSYVITTLPTSRAKANLTIADPCKRTALDAIKLPLVVQPHLVVILDVDRAQKSQRCCASLFRSKAASGMLSSNGLSLRILPGSTRRSATHGSYLASAPQNFRRFAPGKNITQDISRPQVSVCHGFGWLRRSAHSCPRNLYVFHHHHLSALCLLSVACSPPVHQPFCNSCQIPPDHSIERADHGLMLTRGVSDGNIAQTTDYARSVHRVLGLHEERDNSSQFPPHFH